MKVLVTGSSGFIGSAIIREFERLGIECFPVSRENSPSLDITSKYFVKRALTFCSRCEVIVHSAACLSTNSTDPNLSSVNCLGLHNVIALAKLLSVRSFIYLSSIQVIGVPQQLPVKEDHPAIPMTSYHASKLYGEHLMNITGKDSFRTVSLRLTSPVGRYASPSKIFGNFVNRSLNGEPIQLAGKGERKQNYVDTRDIARAVIQCIESDSRGVFNIAGKQSISNLQLAETCISSTESMSAIEFSGLPDSEENLCWDISIEKARKHFGYNPRHEISDSILECALSLRETRTNQ